MRRPGVRIPLPPVYARIAGESVDCRAVALAKADNFEPATSTLRATTRQAKVMVKFFYVYILQSELDPRRFYTGITDNLPPRLQAHNTGRVAHRKKWKPRRLKTYLGFSDRARAVDFERYLKSASGRAFIKNRL